MMKLYPVFKNRANWDFCARSMTSNIQSGMIGDASKCQTPLSQLLFCPKGFKEHIMQEIKEILEAPEKYADKELQLEGILYYPRVRKSQESTWDLDSYILDKDDSNLRIKLYLLARHFVKMLRERNEGSEMVDGIEGYKVFTTMRGHLSNKIGYRGKRIKKLSRLERLKRFLNLQPETVQPLEYLLVPESIDMLIPFPTPVREFTSEENYRCSAKFTKGSHLSKSASKIPELIMEAKASTGLPAAHDLIDLPSDSQYLDSYVWLEGYITYHRLLYKNHELMQYVLMAHSLSDDGTTMKFPVPK